MLTFQANSLGAKPQLSERTCSTDDLMHYRLRVGNALSTLKLMNFGDHVVMLA
jgi:hypothetical protein